MKVTKELLYKFKEGYCSLEEKAAIEAWLNDGTWPKLDSGEPVPEEVKHVIWEKLNSRIILPSKERWQWRLYLPRAAAIALIILGSGTLLFYYLSSKRSYKELVYTTAQHERKRVVLSDSSVIFLSPGSSIKVQQPFPKNKRDIVLSGEAFFEVAQDPLRPFTVITDNIRTTALGTS
ncbi:MAG TPA: FecR domain-containing protein, partial [Candidatus Babeliaceae bacterium]|nr:FecR domain-containing protein [Candidatus Babeliaceae bacterium]